MVTTLNHAEELMRQAAINQAEPSLTPQTLRILLEVTGHPISEATDPGANV